MTSIPASRSALAMIFAPRSWPSRPGLATTTRVLGCVVALMVNGEPGQVEEDVPRLAPLTPHRVVWDLAAPPTSRALRGRQASEDRRLRVRAPDVLERLDDLA